MIGSLFRVLFGFLIACLVAGVTQVTFALTPEGMTSIADGTSTNSIEMILLTATHAAVFSAPFALVAAAIGEWLSARSALYYVVVGLIVAMVGFLAQYHGETTGDPTIANTYATMAYVTTGIVAGLVYWLLAGRRAGEDPMPEGSEPSTLAAAAPPPPPRKPIEVAGAPRPAAAPGSAAAPARPAAPTAPAAPAKPAGPPPAPPAPAKPAAPAAPASSVPSTPPPGTKS